MALTYDTLNSFMKNFPDIIRDNVVKNVPLVKWALQHEMGQRDGNKIEVGIRFATPGITAFNGTTDTFTISQTETHTKAVYQWGFYYHTEAIYWRDWQAAKNNKNSIANIAVERGEAMKDGVMTGLEAELFAVYDGTTHTFNGLPDIVSTSDPTNQASGLGGIAVADAPWWKANSVAYDSSAGDLRHFMSSMVRQLSVAPFGKPDLIITTGDIYDKYYDEIASKQGFLGSKIPDYGFDSVIPFQGIPLTWSEHCPSGTMYFLNSKFMHLKIHPDDFIKISPWEKKSTTDPTLVSTVTLSAQMIVSARKALGIITSIS